jgi:hypothetical protein
MKQYLKYIHDIIDAKLKGSIVTFENLESDFIMNNGSSLAEISRCELLLKNNLPEEYNYFLQNYNGGVLFKIDDYAGFKLLSNTELIKHNEFQRKSFGQDWDFNILLFCECIGDAEYLGFNLNEQGRSNIVHCIMDSLPQEWEIIENSFDDLIKKIIEEKGKKYWLY